MALLVTLFLVLVNIFNTVTTNTPKAEGLTAIEVNINNENVNKQLTHFRFHFRPGCCRASCLSLPLFASMPACFSAAGWARMPLLPMNVTTPVIGWTNLTGTTISANQGSLKLALKASPLCLFSRALH